MFLDKKQNIKDMESRGSNEFEFSLVSENI